jgi:hypothetical protein
MNVKRCMVRGKRTDNGEWICGNLVTGLFFTRETHEDIPYILTVDSIDYDCFEDLTEDFGYYQVDPETVEPVAVAPKRMTKDENGRTLRCYFCPNCDAALGNECDCHGKKFIETNYCPECGQRLDWSEAETDRGGAKYGQRR